MSLSFGPGPTAQGTFGPPAFSEVGRACRQDGSIPHRRTPACTEPRIAGALVECEWKRDQTRSRPGPLLSLERGTPAATHRARRPAPASSAVELSRRPCDRRRLRRPTRGRDRPCPNDLLRFPGREEPDSRRLATAVTPPAVPPRPASSFPGGHATGVASGDRRGAETHRALIKVYGPPPRAPRIDTGGPSHGRFPSLRSAASPILTDRRRPRWG
jgi:hypothetical protein